MRFKSSSLSILFMVLWTLPAYPQLLDHVQGEILVQFNAEVDPLSWSPNVSALRSQGTDKIEHRCISENFRMWSLKFDWRSTDEQALLRSIQNDPAVRAAQFNHFVELRSRNAIPNDPLFSNQWYLKNTGQRAGFIPGMDLGMESAWDKTTGGVTPEGDTIVICVIDNGFDINHEDFENNLWKNHQEIPDNGFDDDGNGYIDDYAGWNVARQDDQIDDQNWHGTLTAGIIGAKGNNGIGVTGINWDVKLMIVVGGFGQAVESRIIQAYDYCLAQRRLYNETDGAKGAFVVASNSSWGVSKSFPEEYPLWCAVYDSLGMEGVINIGATDNKDVDVDLVGDMPTSCPSDFLISVTNVGGDGQKIQDAGYGATTIDLGAFGDQVFITGNDNIYLEDGGTSFAAPMVTAAVGLLYAADCPSFSAIYKESPVDAALMIKSALLRSVNPEPTLAGITVTGGRLNINNAIELLLSECATCPPLLQVGTEALTDVSTNIKWLSNELIERVDFRWRQQGDSTWQELLNISSPLSFDNLLVCTTYEYQFKIYCSEETNPYTDRTYTFTTDGCCDPPKTTRISFVGFTSVLLNWDPVLAANSYTLRYRPIGEETWATSFSPTDSRSIQQLERCTDYEIQIRTNCDGEDSEFGNSVFITTLGCGACIEAGYCEPGGVTSDRSESEWIGRVKINDFSNTSAGEGYSDFTGLESVVLKAGDTFRLRIEPKFSGFAFDEYIKVWIDFDQDGFFSSLDVVYDTEESGSDILDTLLMVPETAILGKTRMRVIMKFNAEPSACVSDVNNFFGEVEDYCVTIEEVTALKRPTILEHTQLHTFPNPVSEALNIRLDLQKELSGGILSVYDLNGRRIWQEALQNHGLGSHRFYLNTRTWMPGMYFVQIQSQEGILTKKVLKQ